MKTVSCRNERNILELLRHLNFCHDASMRKICFSKDRQVDRKDGALVYPFGDIRDTIKCDIQVELILNSYEGAKTDQIVILEFKESTAFELMQTCDFDYSDIYELRFEQEKGPNFHFTFYATGNKVKVFSISCKQLICKEL